MFRAFERQLEEWVVSKALVGRCLGVTSVGETEKWVVSKELLGRCPGVLSI